MTERPQHFKWLLSFKGSHLKWKHRLSFPSDNFSQTCGRTLFWLACLPSLATLLGHSFKSMAFGVHVVRQLNKVRFSGETIIQTKGIRYNWAVKTPSGSACCCSLGGKSKFQIILTYFLGFGLSWAHSQYILLQWIQVGT